MRETVSSDDQRRVLERRRTRARVRSNSQKSESDWKRTVVPSVDTDAGRSAVHAARLTEERDRIGQVPPDPIVTLNKIPSKSETGCRLAS